MYHNADIHFEILNVYVYFNFKTTMFFRKKRCPEKKNIKDFKILSLSACKIVEWKCQFC